MLLYEFLPVHCLVNLARLCFVDGENIHQILHVSIAQSLQVRKTRFYQGKRLLFTDRQGTGKRLCSLRYLLFYHSCCRCVLADVDLPSR